MTRHKCFNCETPTAAILQRIKPPVHRKYICTDARCWRAWWALLERKVAA